MDQGQWITLIPLSTHAPLNTSSTGGSICKICSILSGMALFRKPPQTLGTVKWRANKQTSLPAASVTSFSTPSGQFSLLAAIFYHPFNVYFNISHRRSIITVRMHHLSTLLSDTSTSSSHSCISRTIPCIKLPQSGHAHPRGRDRSRSGHVTTETDT